MELIEAGCRDDTCFPRGRIIAIPRAPFFWLRLVLPYLLTLAGPCTFSIQSIAGEFSDCDSALKMSTYSKLDNSHRDARLALQITREEYNKITDSGKANVLLDGFGVGGGYDAFRERVLKDSASYKASLTADETHNLLMTYLSDSTRGAYHDCVEAVSRRGGLHLYMKSATPRDVTLYVVWHPRAVMEFSRWFSPSAAPEPSHIALAWSGGEGLTPTLPTDLLMGDGHPISIPRPAAGITLTVSSGGEGGDVTIVPLPEPIPPPPPPRFQSTNKMSIRLGENTMFQFSENPSGGTLKPWSYTAEQAGQVHISAEFVDEDGNSAVYQTCTIFMYDTKLKAERVVGQYISPTGPGVVGCIANAQVNVQRNDVIRVQVGIAGSSISKPTNSMTGSFTLTYL